MLVSVYKKTFSADEPLNFLQLAAPILVVKV